jgi:DNA-directed RNA polymerase specialized sigma24 family protein
LLENRLTMASERRQERGEIEDCFLRYRESGDREALAKSLTLAQGELRRVARFYALDPAEEDDVVQATVLTAIERAAAFDAERRLTPWLIGILLKKIATARRKAWRVSPALVIRTERTPMNSMVGRRLAPSWPRRSSSYPPPTMTCSRCT